LAQKLENSMIARMGTASPQRSRRTTSARGIQRGQVGAGGAQQRNKSARVAGFPRCGKVFSMAWKTTTVRRAERTERLATAAAIPGNSGGISTATFL
jgi:hypothetical protein